MGSKGGRYCSTHHFKQTHRDHREGELGEPTAAPKSTTFIDCSSALLNIQRKLVKNNVE